MAKWVVVAPELAEAHPLHGLGGWLRVGSLLMMVGLLGALLLAADRWVWPGMLPPGAGGGPEETAPGLAALVLAQLGMTVMWFRLWRRFRIAFALVTLAFLLADLAVAGPPDGERIAGGILDIALVLVPLAYMQRSRRFRVTFEHRLRMDDAALRRAA